MIVTFPLCLRYALPAEDDDASLLVSGRLRQGLVSAPVQSAAAAQLTRDLRNALVESGIADALEQVSTGAGLSGAASMD